MTRQFYPQKSELPLLLDGRQDNIFNEDRTIELRVIPGRPRKYLAGSDGFVYHIRQSKGEFIIESIGFLASAPTEKGRYWTTGITDNGIKKPIRIHRLICEAFHGRAPEGKYLVRHLDGNHLNNVPSNLAWGDDADNYRDSVLHGTNIRRKGPVERKLSIEDMFHIQWAIKSSLISKLKLAAYFGVTLNAITRVEKRHQISNPFEKNDGDTESKWRAPRLLICVPCKKESRQYTGGKVNYNDISVIQYVSASRSLCRCNRCGREYYSDSKEAAKIAAALPVKRIEKP